MNVDQLLPRGGKYGNLTVWHRSIDLVTFVYQLTREWPQAERYALVSQTQRAAVSIPANIAEGNGRNGRKEYVHHLGIARGSLHELETLLVVANKVNYLNDEATRESLDKCDEIGRMLTSLIRSLSAPE